MLPEAVEIVGLGEVLWDLLPGGKQPGGAPFNFAFHCHQLGHTAAIVSRVGADELRGAIRAAIRRLGLDDGFVQQDDTHPTGTVQVAVSADGQPHYTITPAIAWDHLAWNVDLEALLARTQAVCFGTLAQRHPDARATIQAALRAARNALVVFDVNLRQHYYDRDTLAASLTASRWVKLNEDELAVLRDLLGLVGKTPSALLRELRRCYGLEVAALTRGERGCLVQADDEEISVAGVRVQVVDTVGAGDAFTAGLLCAVLEGQALGDAAAFANRLAARVAGAAGGTPVLALRSRER